MNIKKFTVGPIVGYTTSSSCRIFGRAEGVDSAVQIKKCYGVARVAVAGNKFSNQITLFKINPIFDFSGVTEFYNLKANQHYQFQTGYFFDDRSFEEIEQDKDNLNWTNASEGQFKTTSEDKNDKVSFVFGSCRYMLKIMTFLFDDRGDKIFRSINELIQNKNINIDHCMMLGDQIYADDLNFIGADTNLKEFNERYREVFSQEHISKLMSNVPTYMILDDHEIENDWPAESNSKDFQSKYPAALHAYQTYQVSHSPVIPMQNGQLLGTPDRFWYNYDNGCSEFFILDTRTERSLPEISESDKVMISTRQLLALKEWLNNNSGKIKFIGTSVPFFPDVSKGLEDKWGGFRVQRTEILNFIKDNKIQKVVFLSGDVHSSLSAQLVSKDDNEVKITSIISSSFFWPVPISRSKSFQLNGVLDTIGSSKFEVINSSEIVTEDNFTHVVASPNQLEITVYDRKGNILVNTYTIDLN